MKAATEALHPDAMRLDAEPVQKIVRLLVYEERRSAEAVYRASADIARAAESIIEGMRIGGRLIYVGAGTSGRLAVLDAAECIPTFGIPQGIVVAVLAGGPAAFFQSVEGAEDNTEDARFQMRQLALTKRDTVCGIAASGTTPFTRAAVAFAREKRASTILITCNALSESAADAPADVVIHLDTGPEVLSGSTRLKAGTAQKITLNTLSTTVMAKLGHTYGGLMIDVQATNAKLSRRKVGIVATLANIDHDRAQELLVKASWCVKTAVVMHYHKHVGAEEARWFLRKHDDNLRSVIGDVDYTA